MNNPIGDPTAALQLILQLGQQARSEDELAEMLAQFGEPPGPPTPQVPQVMGGPRVPPALPGGLPPARPGTVPAVPQTRGEAVTNPSLGSLLG